MKTRTRFLALAMVATFAIAGCGEDLVPVNAVPVRQRLDLVQVSNETVRQQYQLDANAPLTAHSGEDVLQLLWPDGGHQRTDRRQRHGPGAPWQNGGDNCFSPVGIGVSFPDLPLAFVDYSVVQLWTAGQHTDLVMRLLFRSGYQHFIRLKKVRDCGAGSG